MAIALKISAFPVSISVVELDLSKSTMETFGYWIEIVRTHALHPCVMVIDEEGLVKNSPPNLLGTLVSGYPEVIAGDVYILGEGMGDDGPELQDIDPAILTAMLMTLDMFIQ